MWSSPSAELSRALWCPRWSRSSLLLLLSDVAFPASPCCYGAVAQVEKVPGCAVSRGLPLLLLSRPQCWLYGGRVGGGGAKVGADGGERKGGGAGSAASSGLPSSIGFYQS